jgi:hypothetical protein
MDDLAATLLVVDRIRVSSVGRAFHVISAITVGDTDGT